MLKYCKCDLARCETHYLLISNYNIWSEHLKSKIILFHPKCASFGRKDDRVGNPSGKNNSTIKGRHGRNTLKTFPNENDLLNDTDQEQNI